MLGFHIPENFRCPYLALVTEFWRRWHITLGTWFREYHISRSAAATAAASA